MSYFTQDDFHSLVDDDGNHRETVQQRLQDLHKKVYEGIQGNNIDLHITLPPSKAVHNTTLSDFETNDVLTVTYMRKREHAVMVEKLMGRDEVASLNTIERRFHTGIELRLATIGLALELVMSPDAWWDQQNLLGKLRIPRHKQEFYSLLMNFDSDYRMGFWQGAYLSDMHLKAQYFQHPRIMNEWISTFHPNADWFRLGIWYEIEAEELSAENIVKEIMKQIELMYQIYRFSIWTTDNNFRDFLEE